MHARLDRVGVQPPPPLTLKYLHLSNLNDKISENWLGPPGYLNIPRTTPPFLIYSTLIFSIYSAFYK